MIGAAVVEQFATTREQLDSACDLLISPTPEVLDRCSMLLESASRQMAECQPRIAELRGDAAAIEEAWRVRRSFVRVGKLMENAARFHGNWMSMRGTLTGGYTERGEAAPVRHAGRICVEA
jgi:hypothetical protein